jgi:hypothetical protein
MKQLQKKIRYTPPQGFNFLAGKQKPTRNQKIKNDIGQGYDLNECRQQHM